PFQSALALRRRFRFVVRSSRTDWLCDHFGHAHSVPCSTGHRGSDLPARWDQDCQHSFSNLGARAALRVVRLWNSHRALSRRVADPVNAEVVWMATNIHGRRFHCAFVADSVAPGDASATARRHSGDAATRPCGDGPELPLTAAESKLDWHLHWIFLL